MLWPGVQSEGKDIRVHDHSRCHTDIGQQLFFCFTVRFHISARDVAAANE